jgi:hypothetical protein
MWFIIFTKEGGYNEVLRIIRSPRKEQREIKSFYLSGGSIRKTLTPRLIEEIWDRSSFCSEYMKLSERPMNFIRILKRAGVIVRWYEI